MPGDKEEVTFKEVYFKIIYWTRYLLKKWIWIVAAGIVCGGLSLLYVFNQKPNYTAKLTFILSNNSSGGSSLYGLASQFGLDLSSNSDAFSGDNIISLMNSQTMVQKVLFRKPDGINVTLLNIFVKDQKLDESWNQKERTKGSYPFPDDPEKMNYTQDSLVRDIYNNIEASYLTVARPDKDLSVYNVITISKNEIFSLFLTKYLVDATSRFYIDTKTSVAKNNLAMLEHEADSIHNLLRGSIVSTAQAYDYTYNLNPAYQSQRTGAQEGQLSVTAIGNAYSEVLRNLELAKISLQKETPLYQILDEPQLPLIAEKTGKLFALVIGGFIGGFIIIFILIIRKYIKKSVTKKG